MPRPSSFRAALAGLLTFGVAGAGLVAPGCGRARAHRLPAAPCQGRRPAPRPHRRHDPGPAARRGDVEIAGTVTNVSDETFTRVNLHAFSSEHARSSTRSRLSQSATIDPTLFVGDRVTVPGTFDTIDELAPGAVRHFSDSVPVELLATSGEPGVYWIGIHAIGDSSVPRDLVADGRARTFIPRVRVRRRPGTRRPSVILPIRSRVWFDEDGAVAGTDRWARRLAEGGSLDGVLDMADSAGSAPYSWLVDPAVLHALCAAGAGQPAAHPHSRPRRCPGRSPHPSSPRRRATESPTRRPRRSPRPSPSRAEEPTRGGGAARRLRRGVAGAVQAARGRDAGAARCPTATSTCRPSIRNDRTRFDQAVARGAEVMAALTLAVPADRGAGERPAEPRGHRGHATGHDDPAGGQRLRHPADQPDLRRPAARARGGGHEHRGGGGRPGPTASNDPLALRQRLLSEAALRLEAGRHRPAGRHPADGVARRGRRVVLHRPRAVVARPGPRRGRRRPHAQGRPCREPHLHRRRHRRRSSVPRPSPRPTAPARPPRCWSRWSSR